MDVVLQTAVLGVGLLQPGLHVLQLSLVATLHLNEKTSVSMWTTGSKAVYCRWRIDDTPPLCFAATGSAQLWLCSAGSAGPRLWTETFSLWPKRSACSLPPAGETHLYQVRLDGQTIRRISKHFHLSPRVVQGALQLPGQDAALVRLLVQLLLNELETDFLWGERFRNLFILDLAAFQLPEDTEVVWKHFFKL